MKVGLTLPSFQDDPASPLAVAAAAEASGVDGVFAFDHLFRSAADGAARPALECTTLLGALASRTERILLGTLVVRATLRPPATLACALDTVQRVSGGRLIAGVGAGDRESRGENESFGLGFGTLADRLGALGATVAALEDRGYPVWVGGSARHVGPVAATAGGWNRWGVSVAHFAAERDAVLSRRVLSQRVGDRPFTASWGGLVVLGPTDAHAAAKAERLGAGPGVLVGGPQRMAAALRGYGAAGAEWVMVGPLDSADPENATILGEQVAPLVR